MNLKSCKAHAVVSDSPMIKGKYLFYCHEILEWPCCKSCHNGEHEFFSHALGKNIVLIACCGYGQSCDDRDEVAKFIWQAREYRRAKDRRH
jgi:hypothetical protein